MSVPTYRCDHRHHTPVSRGLVFPQGNHVSPINKIQTSSRDQVLKVAFARWLVLRTESGLQNSTPSVACYRFLDTAITRLKWHHWMKWCPQCTLLVMTQHTTAFCFLLMSSRHSCVFRNKTNPKRVPKQVTGNYKTLSDDRLLIHSGYEDMSKLRIIRG